MLFWHSQSISPARESQTSSTRSYKPTARESLRRADRVSEPVKSGSLAGIEQSFCWFQTNYPQKNHSLPS
ncbi:hypothetical protein, partial [Klebsiella pneumoniae]|uniref:hypothetical protein n=1 Tax=Klebsiella pneumoniae TaxID=573 RepID=UPI001C6973B7